MVKVTVDDLRRLLGSSLADPVLVLTSGRMEVEPADAETAGASEVITRSDLRARLDGEEATDPALELIAATLTTAVVQRGG
jgi:hypothetical protein